MKYFWLLLFVVLISIHCALGQNTKTIDIKDDFWYKYTADIVVKTGIKNIAQSGNKFDFRFWHLGDATTSIVEVYQEKDSLIRGSITFYTKEHVNETKEKPTGRFYTEVFNIADTDAKKVYQLIVSDSIEDIPTGSQIKQWQTGLDGEEYIFELTNNRNYSFKSYWTPLAQKDVKEAKLIIAFIDSLYRLVDNKKLSAKFLKDIPFESYTADGAYVGLKPLTSWQDRLNYFKERDAYRKKMKIQCSVIIMRL